jgi:hypothetical protein
MILTCDAHAGATCRRATSSITICVAKVVRLRRRVFGHAFLQETDDAIAHVDTRVPDNKLRAMRAVDIVETVLTVMALAISLDIVQERASAIVLTVHRWLVSVTE